LSIIHFFTNIINNKIYISKSKLNDPAYLGSGLQITGAIKKYGKSKFIKTILEECSDLDVNSREIFWIEYFNSTDNSIGYNISKGGSGGNHYWATLTEEQKQEHNRRISESRMGQPLGPRSIQTKQKQSASFWDHAKKNPNFFKDRALAKCKMYTCVNHKTNIVYRTKNLKEFCELHNLNFGSMRHNARTRKNFYDGIWSCSLAEFSNIIDIQVIQMLTDEVHKNNAEYKEKISQARKNKINGIMHTTN
jgi:hypothetical protein